MTLRRLRHQRITIFEYMRGNTSTFGKFGVASVCRIFEFSPSAFDEYQLGRRTAGEIDFKAQNDR